MPPTKLSEVKTHAFTIWYNRLGGVPGTTTSESSTVGSTTVPPVDPAASVEEAPPTLKEDHVFDSSKIPEWDPNEPLPPLDAVPEGFSWRFNPPPMPDVASERLKIRSQEEIREGARLFPLSLIFYESLLETIVDLPPPTIRYRGSAGNHC